MKKVTFQVLEGVDKGRIFRDLQIPVTIGREEGNLLRLNDERVSRFHAKVQQEDDDILLTDLESTNGTRVNGSPIQIRRLRPGDQVSIGRSILMYGSHEEIEARRIAESKPVTRVGGVPEEPTVAGTIPGQDLGFDLNVPNAYGEPTWRGSDKDMPPLPLKLTPAQAARLSEMLDFLHRGITLATENIETNEEGTVVRIGFGEWQTIQSIQMFLARYMRMVADPEHHPD